MVSLVLISQNSREEQILKMAFEQQGIKVLVSKPTYHNYITIVQFAPDLILMEIPHISTEQMDFSSRVRKYKKTRTIPVIGYGNKISDMLKRGIYNQGVTMYIERPLKFNNLIVLFGRLLKNVNKTIEAKVQITDKERDLELIMNSDAPASQKIEAMIRHVSALLAFPFTIAKVLQITQDDKSGAGHLAHAIVTDPAMSTHLLKVANSVFFASSNRRINSIQDSIVRIGFMETKKIIMSMTVMKLFDSKNKNLGFDRIDFWYHSLAVGLIAERIGRMMGDLNLEEVFLAGLIHDLGIIILDEYFPSVFSKVLELNAQNGALFSETMLGMLKVTHNDLIANLFPSWKIPQNITDAVTLQENADQFNEALDTQGKKIAVCVAIANIVAKSLHIGKECDEFIKPLPDWLLKSAHIPYGIQSDFIDHIIHNVEVFRSFLGLEKREYTAQTGVEKSEPLKIAIANTAGNALVSPAIYFTIEKIPFEFIDAEKEMSDYHGKYNLILAIIDSDTNINIIETLGKIILPSKSGDELSTEIKYAPVIVIGPSNFDSSKLPQNFTFINNRYDLRMLDLKLEEILNP